MSEDKTKSGVMALVAFRLEGRKVNVGDIVPKSAFPSKGEWQNLANMTPPRVVEADEKPAKAGGKAMPGAVS